MNIYDIFLDSETLDSLHDPEIVRLPQPERIGALRYGLAVTYDEMYGWRTWTVSLADMLWRHLTMPEARVVGWDILEYDLPVIRHAARGNESVDALDLSAEIMAATGRHYKLDSVARANLNRGKILDTQLVISWLRAGDAASMANVTEYCRNNAQLVYDLCGFIRSGEPLLLPGRQQPTASGWLRTREVTLRLRFDDDGAWQRSEDLRGRTIKQREGD